MSFGEGHVKFWTPALRSVRASYGKVGLRVASGLSAEFAGWASLLDLFLLTGFPSSGRLTKVLCGVAAASAASGMTRLPFTMSFLRVPCPDRGAEDGALRCFGGGRPLLLRG